MDNVLVIIDMQYCFSASRSEELRKEHIKQIKIAKRNGNHIVLLQFESKPPTYIKIRKAVKNYESVGFVVKHTQSGSGPLVQYFKKKQFWPKKIRFMGVNTAHCVYDTVVNFHRHLKKNKKQTDIEILKKGCRCEYQENLGDFSKFEKLGVEII